MKLQLVMMMMMLLLMRLVREHLLCEEQRGAMRVCHGRLDGGRGRSVHVYGRAVVSGHNGAERVRVQHGVAVLVAARRARARTRAAAAAVVVAGRGVNVGRTRRRRWRRLRVAGRAVVVARRRCCRCRCCGSRGGDHGRRCFHWTKQTEIGQNGTSKLH